MGTRFHTSDRDHFQSIPCQYTASTLCPTAPSCSLRGLGSGMGQGSPQHIHCPFSFPGFCSQTKLWPTNQAQPGHTGKESSRGGIEVGSGTCSTTSPGSTQSCKPEGLQPPEEEARGALPRGWKQAAICLGGTCREGAHPAPRLLCFLHGKKVFPLLSGKLLAIIRQAGGKDSYPSNNAI